jgi:hypothetical protein
VPKQLLQPSRYPRPDPVGERQKCDERVPRHPCYSRFLARQSQTRQPSAVRTNRRIWDLPIDTQPVENRPKEQIRARKQLHRDSRFFRAEHADPVRFHQHRHHAGHRALVRRRVSREGWSCRYDAQASGDNAPARDPRTEAATVVRGINRIFQNPLGTISGAFSFLVSGWRILGLVLRQIFRRGNLVVRVYRKQRVVR